MFDITRLDTLHDPQYAELHRDAREEIMRLRGELEKISSNMFAAGCLTFESELRRRQEIARKALGQ